MLSVISWFAGVHFSLACLYYSSRLLYVQWMQWCKAVSYPAGVGTYQPCFLGLVGAYQQELLPSEERQWLLMLTCRCKP